MPETRNPRVRRSISREEILFSVARVPNSTRLLAGSSRGKVFEFDVSQTTIQPRQLAEHDRYVTGVRLVGNTVISGGYDGRLIWWDLEQGREIRRIDNAHSRWIRQLAVSPDGTKIASVADDMVCRVWNVATGARMHELRGHAERTPTDFGSMLYACAFSPDGRHLATGDRVGKVIVWDTTRGQKVAELEAPTLYTWDAVQRIRSIGGIRSLAFSPDGNNLAVGGVGQINNVDGLSGPARVEIFAWARHERLYHFTGQNGIVNRLFYHPENRWLCATGGENNGILIFHNPADRSTIHQGNLPMHVHDIAFNENYTTLYAVGFQDLAVVDLA